MNIISPIIQVCTCVLLVCATISMIALTIVIVKEFLKETEE
jgi:hypothetical protein